MTSSTSSQYREYIYLNSDMVERSEQSVLRHACLPIINLPNYQLPDSIERHRRGVAMSRCILILLIQRRVNVDWDHININPSPHMRINAHRARPR
jgi:hypothetical protein